MTAKERARLNELVALHDNDDIREAVRLCADLERREPDPGSFFVIRSVLEEVADLTESGPVSVGPWERIREQLVPALRRVIQSPSSEAAMDLARCWVRGRQEEPLR